LPIIECELENYELWGLIISQSPWRGIFDHSGSNISQDSR